MEQFEQGNFEIIPISKITQDVAASLKLFDCDDPFLNMVAQKKLIKNDKKNLHKGFVVVADDRIVAYATTKVGSLDKNYLDESGLPKKLPVLCLEQIATDVHYRRRKIASRLLKKVLEITLEISAGAGVYGLYLWSHPDALPFYDSLGFTRLITERHGELDLTLMFMHVQTIKEALV